MVPLKSEVWSDDSFKPRETVQGQRTIESGRVEVSGATGRRRRARAKSRKQDNNWFVAMIAVLAFFIIGIAVSSFRADIESSMSTVGAASNKVAVTVKPGDTLWTFAHRYGAPGNYILDNVDAIARDNAIDPTSTLVPGQRLTIRVENPAVIAKLQHASRVASAE